MSYFLETIPIYTIFIMVLIISANFLAPLFPCRIQKALNNNMYLKHLFGYLTMIFFVTLASPIKNKQIEVVIYQSLIIYILFIMYLKTDIKIFIFILIILFIIYCLILKKNEYETTISDDKIKDELKNNINNIDYIIKILSYMSIILIIIGLLSYMGQKKYEYKNKFNYIKFFLGKPSCKGKSPRLSFIKSFSYLL